ncbi:MULTISPECIES: glutaminyl-peptide cyclotransferase [Deinococcus]|uniref:Glutaminyl-peptide cyclotransferase n=1 Tax=Deinococcus cavernae TaxID=2320857 RepID=A0A418V921_9DEIO|nr:MULTISPECIES: glutaminyl-peptide cyclotransferase [Deinococcus]RJF72615.1 glutaminyl-peptide cyclotransferase [Deinococcus cavernae]
MRLPPSFLLPSLLLLFAAVSAAPAPAAAPATLKPVVVARYPHDPEAFTEGLQYLGAGNYIESTGDGPGGSPSGVRLTDLKTGRVQRQIRTPLAGAFGEGVTVLGGAAYHLTWKDGVAFALDAHTLQEFQRYRYKGEGWGLTTDGQQLIMSDGSPVIVWRAPKTFAVTRSITVTANGQAVKNLNELEYVQGQLYANIWLTDRIARIDPQTGKVTAWIDVSRLTREASAAADKRGRPLTFDDVANGIAFVPERGTLLLTGKRWTTLFEVRLPGVKAEKPAK